MEQSSTSVPGLAVTKGPMVLPSCGSAIPEDLRTLHLIHASHQQTREQSVEGSVGRFLSQIQRQCTLLSLTYHLPKPSPMVTPNWKRSETIWSKINKSPQQRLYLLLLVLVIIIITTHHSDPILLLALDLHTSWDLHTLALLFPTTTRVKDGHLYFTEDDFMLGEVKELVQEIHSQTVVEPETKPILSDAKSCAFPPHQHSTVRHDPREN